MKKIAYILIAMAVLSAAAYATDSYYTIDLGTSGGTQRFTTDLVTESTKTNHVQGFLPMVSDSTGTVLRVGYKSGHLFMPVMLMDVNRADREFQTNGSAYGSGNHGIVTLGYSRATGSYYIPSVDSDGTVLTRGTITAIIGDGTNKMILEQHTTDGESGADWGFPVESYNVLLNVSGTWDRMRSVPTTSDGVSGSYIGHAAEAGLTYGYNGTTWDRIRASSTPSTTIGLVVNNAMLSAATNTASMSASLGQQNGKTIVWKAGSVTTTATTADQVVTGASYTATAGKFFYLQGWSSSVIYSAFSVTTNTNLSVGTINLNTPATTTVVSDVYTIGGGRTYGVAEPIPVAGGVGVWCKVTPLVTASMIWKCNFWGYEK